MSWLCDAGEAGYMPSSAAGFSLFLQLLLRPGGKAPDHMRAVPGLVLALSGGTHCEACASDAMLPCMLACFGSSSLVGILVGYRANIDAAPRRYATAAITAAALTGLLGCGTTGLGGAVGIVAGIVAGGVTGWLFAARAAHA